MHRRSFICVGLLAVLVACRDGPTILEAPVDAETPVEVKQTAQTDVILTVQHMMDDPLVLEIVESLGDRAVALRFDGLRHEIDRQTVRRDVLAMRRSFTATRDFLVSDSEESDMVLRDVLRLVLDDAEMMLVSEADAKQPEEAQGDRAKHGEQMKR